MWLGESKQPPHFIKILHSIYYLFTTNYLIWSIYYLIPLTASTINIPYSINYLSPSSSLFHLLPHSCYYLTPLTRHVLHSTYFKQWSLCLEMSLSKNRISSWPVHKKNYNAAVKYLRQIQGKVYKSQCDTAVCTCWHFKLFWWACMYINEHSLNIDFGMNIDFSS